MFKDEVDAAKRMNQLCEEFGISLQNPDINQKYQVTNKYLFLFHVIVKKS
jgi:hypothetical protein